MKTIIITLLLAFSVNSFAVAQLEGTLWESDYVSGQDRYSLYFTGDNEVNVNTDPNTCDFDEIGRNKGCTKIRVSSALYKMEVAPVRTDRRTLAYDLVPLRSNSAKGILRLVTNLPFTSQNPDALRLVVFDIEGNPVRSVRLLRKQ